MYNSTNGRAHNNSTTCCTTNSPPTDKNVPHPNIVTCRDVGLCRHCDVANFCPLVVNLLLWARPLMVLYSMSVAGVRVVEFGSKCSWLSTWFTNSTRRRSISTPIFAQAVAVSVNRILASCSGLAGSFEWRVIVAWINLRWRNSSFVTDTWCTTPRSATGCQEQKCKTKTGLATKTVISWPHPWDILFSHVLLATSLNKANITIAIQLRYDCDRTTIRLRRIARACFHSTRFGASRKWTYQFFVVVVS